MKISKAVREEAALLCAIAASSFQPGPSSLTTWEAGRGIGLHDSHESQWLAHQAWLAAPGVDSNDYRTDRSERYAEAESRLRTGWSPP